MARLLYKDNEVTYQPCDPYTHTEDIDEASHDGNSPPSCTDPPENSTSDESDQTCPILSQESPTVDPAIDSLSEATCTYPFPDSHFPAQDNHSTCMDDSASTSEHALSVCPSIPSVTTMDANTTTSKSTPPSSNACPPTHLALTTFDEHCDSELKTSLAASISRLVKSDEHLLKEFDELCSTLKEAKKYQM